jgi:hypothetical protein
MMKITNSGFLLTLSILTSSTMLGNSSLTLAQTRGQGPGEFFDRGTDQLQQEINRLQRQQQQEEEQKPTTLEVKTENTENNQTEETISSPITNDENVPNSSSTEIDMK